MENPFEKFNLDEVNEVIGQNFRNTDTKDIGDRVQIIDYSSVTRSDGTHIDELDEDMQFDADIYFIVIKTREKHLYDAVFTKYNQDLVIVNSYTNMEYRVTSGHVMLYK